MKPELNHTVRLEKSRTIHLCGYFSLKNHFMGKNRDLCELRMDLTVLRTVIRPLLMVPYFPLNLNLKKKKFKKKKNIEKEKRKKTTTKQGWRHEVIAPSSSSFFLFFLLLLCSSPSLLFLLNFVIYMVWFLTFSFLVFVMTTLTLATSIGNIESFLSSPHVYSTLTLAA